MKDQAAHVGAVSELINAVEGGEYVSGKTISLNTFTGKTIFFFIIQIVHNKHPFVHINQQHQDQLLRSFRSGGYSYACGIMYLVWQADSSLVPRRIPSMFEHSGILSL